MPFEWPTETPGLFIYAVMRPPWILHPHGYMNYIPWYDKLVLFISLRSATDIFHDSVQHDVERDIKGYQVFTRGAPACEASTFGVCLLASHQSR